MRRIVYLAITFAVAGALLAFHSSPSANADFGSFGGGGTGFAGTQYIFTGPSSLVNDASYTYGVTYTVTPQCAPNCNAPVDCGNPAFNDGPQFDTETPYVQSVQCSALGPDGNPFAHESFPVIFTEKDQKTNDLANKLTATQQSVAKFVSSGKYAQACSAVTDLIHSIRQANGKSLTSLQTNLLLTGGSGTDVGANNWHADLATLAAQTNQSCP